MEHGTKIGLQGELAAARYFKSLGYRVYWDVRYGTKQIDLVACKPGEMRLIEVKTGIYTIPQERISLAKRRCLRSGLNIFNLILAKNIEYFHVDIIFVVPNKNNLANIRYFKDVL